jgi:DNA polymerase (family 10)
MNNSDIADIFKLTAQLLELHDDNPFKIKSLLNASFKIDKLEPELSKLTKQEIEKLEGIGKSTASKINELLTVGTTEELKYLLEITPAGVIDMLHVKGIGPKKVALLWTDLGIESIGELLYACNENRLIDLKGFGLKTQDSIRKNIEYKLSNAGNYLFAEADREAQQIILFSKIHFPNTHFEFTGQFIRHCEILTSIDILTTDALFILNEYENTSGIPINITYINSTELVNKLFETSGSAAFVNAMELKGWNKTSVYQSEIEIFDTLKLPYIPHYARENGDVLDITNPNYFNSIIAQNQIKGIFHVHTKYSDGANSLKEMAMYVKEQGFEYLGITDHSQSAFYANGLKPERVLAQHKEIDQLNIELAPFKIFKGIESDILYDGSLDYEEDILQQFDFVIASVHSVLKMDIEKATARLIKAIENPYTTMLGHPTGRLLLSREGYPLHFTKIIDACGANQVIIELNANPYRLDIDWRWINYCIEKGVKISINPDAHSLKGLHDITYGVYAAQKGFLKTTDCYNTQNLEAIINSFKVKKNIRI